MKIPPTKSYLWNKGDSFNKIYFMVINISDSHSINDIITTLDNKIPIKNTHTHTMKESYEVATLIMKIVFDVSNIYKAMFINRDSMYAKGFKPNIPKCRA